MFQDVTEKEGYWARDFFYVKIKFWVLFLLL